MHISERLKQACEAKGWKITELSELTGIPYRTLQGYLKKEREPNAEGMKGFSKAGINLNWLVSGIGEMFVTQEQQQNLTESELNLLSNFRLANEVGKEVISTTSDLISAKLKSI